jgi:hypothetical protein
VVSKFGIFIYGNGVIGNYILGKFANEVVCYLFPYLEDEVFYYFCDEILFC